MILTIAKREFKTLFLSPLAWVILAVIQIILAWSFFSSVDVFFSIQADLTTMKNAPGVTDLIATPLFEVASIVLLMVTPLLTMRLISEERRTQTMSLLFSAPVSMAEIVVGKYLGVMIFLIIMVLLILAMPLSLLLGANLDLGMLAAGSLGLILLVASFAAVGLFMSTLTVQPTIAELDCDIL